MPDELPVHISRQELHGLDIPASFEASDSFDVALINHGEALHVHLHLDDALSQVAHLDAGNHYVEGQSQRAVAIHVDSDQIPEDGIFGRLKVVSAYGSETRWIDIELVPPEEEDDRIEVDESLAEPKPREPTAAGSPLDKPELPVLGLGGVALVVALVAAVLIQDTLVLVGSLAVLAGVLVAVYFLVQDSYSRI